jgi:uncharacterized protein
MDNIIIEKTKITNFCKKYHIRMLAFFGSVLRDDFRPDSDVDVLVEFEPDFVPGLRFFAMEQELSEILGHKVELHTLNFLSPYFREKVAKETVIHYVAAWEFGPPATDSYTDMTP